MGECRSRNLIVVCIGFGYLGKYLLKNLSCQGIKSFGITSKISKNTYVNDNLQIQSRSSIKQTINLSTNLIVTAPPNEYGCPVFRKFKAKIIKSNIKSIAYISSTGIYGDFSGEWVNETTKPKEKIKYNKRLLAEHQWVNFCRKKKISYNVIRIAGIYGPNRVNSFQDNNNLIIRKENQYFSRIHIQDAARIISKILLQNRRNEFWNLSDDVPSSREDFLMEVVKLKKIKNYKFINYDQAKKKISKKADSFWSKSKKVSNYKIKEKLDVVFAFPNYKRGLKSLVKYL